MKKVIAAILAVALFSVCFAACEQKKTAPPTEEDGETAKEMPGIRFTFTPNSPNR